MTASDQYLFSVIKKYAPRDLGNAQLAIDGLKGKLLSWSAGCSGTILNSGSRAKGTAISMASDVDYLVSLSSSCEVKDNPGLKGLYDALYKTLEKDYTIIKKQNVSIRLRVAGVEVDVTPGRKHSGSTNDHSLYLSKTGTWKQTNIQKHIDDIKNSGRTNEIKLLKIWREQNKLDFPSIYLEYLICLIILYNKDKGEDVLARNFLLCLKELSRKTGNPMDSRVVDPANTNNILSELLTKDEKERIRAAAESSIAKPTWEEIIW